jgi:hypothetical protein
LAAVELPEWAVQAQVALLQLLELTHLLSVEYLALLHLAVVLAAVDTLAKLTVVTAVLVAALLIHKHIQLVTLVVILQLKVSVAA